MMTSPGTPGEIGTETRPHPVDGLAGLEQRPEESGVKLGVEDCHAMSSGVRRYELVPCLSFDQPVEAETPQVVPVPVIQVHSHEES